MMSKYIQHSGWDPERGFIGYNDPDPSPYEEIDTELFKMGYDTVRCIKCQGIAFNVGVGSYDTGIKCVNCGWERSIHQG
jgi:hypothetical protein